MALIPSFFGGRRSNVLDPFSLDIWDTLMGLGSPIMGSGQDREGTAAMADARIDWKETPEAHIIQVDLPGLQKVEVKVEVEDGRVLQVSGERCREQEDKTDKWHRVERSDGKFVRRFRLPENVRLDDVRANMEYGLLNIVVPKAEDKKPKVKAINIYGGEEDRGPSDISSSPLRTASLHLGLLCTYKVDAIKY